MIKERNIVVQVLLSIITCGIYTFFWNYKMGKTMYAANQKAGINAEDNSVLYLILSIFGLSIVNYCIIQNELNTIARQSNVLQQ